MGKILILGASGVLGQALVEQLHQKDLILAGRHYPTDEHHLQLNLKDFESIRHALIILKDISLDAVFVNSGIYEVSEILENGFENNLMVNAVGPYFLIRRLCQMNPSLKIILTTSVSIQHAEATINVKKPYLIYRNTKLIELVLFEKLKKEYPQHQFVYAHPGITASSISKKLHGRIIGFWLQHFASKPTKAVRSMILAFQDEYKIETGWYAPGGWFELWGKPKWRKKQFNFKSNALIEEIIKKEGELKLWD